MIRRLSSNPASHSGWKGILSHPDPDSLLTLINDAVTNGPARAAALSGAFSEVVSSVRIGRTHKLTRPNRLAAPNRLLCGHIAPDPCGRFELLDVGGSDGITTLEAVGTLERYLGIDVHACLIDPFIRLNRYRSGTVVEYRTPDQSPVMVRVGAIGLQLSSLDTSRDPVSRVLGHWYLSRAAFRESMELDASISLVNPLVTADPRISVREWDVLRHDEALSGRFNAVRACNVLNHSYFSPEQIRSALVNLHDYLRRDGVLLVSRSLASKDGETDHGSIWRRTTGGFARLADLGNGSEIGALVDRFAAEPRGDQLLAGRLR